MSPNEFDNAITPKRVAKVLWRRKLVCLTVAAIVFLGGTVFVITRPKLYESSSSVALLPASTNASVLPNYPNLIASLIPTYVQLVSSPVLLNQVAATLPFQISEGELANDVFGASMSSAAVINVVGQNADPARAQQIAAAATAAFLANVKGNGVVVAHIYARPTVPTHPSSPRTNLLLVVILVLAAILGLAAGLIWDRLSGRRDDEDQIGGTTIRPPLLGIVRDAEQAGAVSSIPGGLGATAAHDGWRLLRSNFMSALLGQQMHSVTVLSQAPGAGKTAIAANLAATAAEMGLTVILVDADVRHPRLHEVFSLDNEEGLTSTILHGVDPATLLRPVPDVAGLHVVTAGPPLPAQQYEAGLYREQLPRLTSLADLVILDGPHLQDDPDAGVLARVTDGVVLVVHSGVLTWEQVWKIVHDLTSCGARVLGTVLTGKGKRGDRGEFGEGQDSYHSPGATTPDGRS